MVSLSSKPSFRISFSLKAMRQLSTNSPQVFNILNALLSNSYTISTIFMYSDYARVAAGVLLGEPTEGDANSERSVCCERNYELIKRGSNATVRLMRVIQVIEPSAAQAN